MRKVLLCKGHNKSPVSSVSVKDKNAVSTTIFEDLFDLCFSLSADKIGTAISTRLARWALDSRLESTISSLVTIFPYLSTKKLCCSRMVSHNLELDMKHRF